MPNKIREEFEAWAVDNCGQYSPRGKYIRGGNWSYYHNWLQSMWVTWCASRESVQIELPEVKANDYGDWSAIDDSGAVLNYLETVAAIEAAGLKVKPC